MDCTFKYRLTFIFSLNCFLALGQISMSSLYKEGHPSQVSGYIKKITPVDQYIIPAALMTIGGVTIATKHIIDNDAIQHYRERKFPSFRTHVDDYLQFSPFFIGSLLSTIDKKSDQNLFYKRIAFNEIFISFTVPLLKSISRVRTPDSNRINAFPSGHTAQAFSSATLFADTFGQKKPWICIASYTVASAVGILRVLNNKHWMSDVIAGAGYGILSAKISERVFSTIVHPERKNHDL